MHAETQGLISGTEAACLAELYNTVVALKVYLEKLEREAPPVTWWQVIGMEETLLEPEDQEWNGELCIGAGLTEEGEILGVKARGEVLQGRKMEDQEGNMVLRLVGEPGYVSIEDSWFVSGRRPLTEHSELEVRAAEKAVAEEDVALGNASFTELDPEDEGQAEAELQRARDL